MSAPAAHRVVVREHPTAPTATWSCSCGTTEGQRPQSSPFANARATEHAGGVFVPEPWQDAASPADLTDPHRSSQRQAVA